MLPAVKKGPSLPAAHQVSAYRCSLPGLAGFTGLSCAGPGPIVNYKQQTRSAGAVNNRLKTMNKNTLLHMPYKAQTWFFVYS